MRIAFWVAMGGALVCGCGKTETQPTAPVTSTAATAATSVSPTVPTGAAAPTDAGAVATRTPKKLEDAIWEPDVKRHIISHSNKPLALVEVRKNVVTMRLEAEGKAATEFKRVWTELHPETGFDESVHAPTKDNTRGPLESRKFGPESSAWALLLEERLDVRRYSLHTVPRWPDAAPPASMRELIVQEDGQELAVLAFANNNALLKRFAAGGGGSFLKSFFESATMEPPSVVIYARPNGTSGPDTLVVAKSRPGEASYPATIRAYFATHINRYDRYVLTIVP